MKIYINDEFIENSSNNKVEVEEIEENLGEERENNFLHICILVIIIIQWKIICKILDLMDI